MGLVALALAAVAAPAAGRGAGHRTAGRARRSRRPCRARSAMRATFIRSAGFDPFSGTDVLPQISLAIAARARAAGAFAFAAGVRHGLRRPNADARGAPSTIMAWRLPSCRGALLRSAVRLRVRSRWRPGCCAAPPGWRTPPAPTANSWTITSTCRRSTPAGRGAAASPDQQSGRRLVHRGGRLRLGASHHLLLAPAAATRDQAKLAASTSGPSIRAASSCASPSRSLTTGSSG